MKIFAATSNMNKRAMVIANGDITKFKNLFDN